MHRVGAGLALELASDWEGLALDWYRPDRDALASAWHQIGIGLALYRHYADTGLGWIGTGLTLNWLLIGRIDTGLTSDWNWIGPRLTSDRRRIENRLAGLTLDWGQIGDGLALD